MPIFMPIDQKLSIYRNKKKQTETDRQKDNPSFYYINFLDAYFIFFMPFFFRRIMLRRVRHDAT